MVFRVPYHRHDLGAAELESIKNTFESGFLTGGPRVAEFENCFARFLSYPVKVVGVNSGTNALHLSLVAFGVNKAGWRVITTPLSFVATANAALYQGIRPTFVDVDARTGLMDLNQLEDAIKKIGHRRAAIIPVHLYGQMIDMGRLRGIVSAEDDSGAVIIEDAAHCVDGWRSDYRPGQLGDAACFSFHALKTMTSGDGGAIAVRDPEKAKLLTTLRSHGISKSLVERHYDYSIPEMTEFGYKYNMSDIQAALLLPQISEIENRRFRRAEIAHNYYLTFLDEPKIGLLEKESGVINSRSQYVILVDPNKRQEIISGIRAAGVEVIATYYPIHLMPFYRRLDYERGAYPNAEKIGLSGIALPIYPKLTEESQKYVIETVLKVVKSY